MNVKIFIEGEIEVKKVYEGNLIGTGLKLAIVVSRFNELNGRLLTGAEDALKRHGVEDENIEIYWVPGAFEIPLTAQKLAESKKFDAVITLGTVIRGATPHFDYVSNEVAKGVARSREVNRHVPLFLAF